MTQALNKLFHTFKIYTTAQIGIDLNISENLLAKGTFVRFFELKSRQLDKTPLICENSDILLFDEENEILKYLEYRRFDLAVISETFDFDFVRNCTRLLKNNRTKFILIPSKYYSVINKSNNYFVANLGDGYYVQYLDTLQES